MRLLALLCLVFVLVACIAAPIHKHDSAQEGNCLICHSAERGTIVHINADAGKAYHSPWYSIIVAPRLSPVLEPPDLTRSSRAPPPQLLSL